MRQGKRNGLASAPTDSQALAQNQLFESPSKRFVYSNASRPNLNMFQALSRLGVAFNRNKATQWQRVKCPACASPEAQVLLHGRHGASGGFRCNQCATKGGALVVLARGLNVPVNVARGLL